MTTLNSIGAAGGEPAYKDRSTALIIVGVIEILIGLGCALLVPLTLVVISVTGGWGMGGMEPRSTVPMLALYGVAAVVFLWIGVGTIRARRWARELMLSLSWIWLVTGVCSLALSWLLIPPLLGDLGGASGYPAELLPLVTAVTVAVLSFLYVVLPGAFVLFYRSPHVAATCRERSVEPQWSDGLPQRLLTLTILWVMLAVSVLVMPAYGWIVPFFGVVVAGTKGLVIWIAFFVSCLVLAWGTSLRALWAWWAAMGLTILAASSTLITFSRVELADFVPAMGLAAEQEAIFSGVLALDRWLVVLFWFAVWASFIGYLLTVRRYFAAADAHE